VIAAISLLVVVGGCGRETPAQTQTDVVKAEDAGSKGVADATQRASDKMANARNDVTKTQTEVAHDGVDAARSVTVAKADAAYKVAIARCEGDPGDARKACQDLAERELAAAKASANATRKANDPKP
jgi:hypothetical protein